MTILFRRARNTDLAAIHHLAEHSGTGLTTLPKDIDLLKRRLDLSTESFGKQITHPEGEYYLFVLEDTSNNRIIGTSAIAASLGHDTIFYSYKLSKETTTCHSLNIQNEHELLSLVTDNQGRSELCTLFLEKDYRHTGNGLLLSRSRLLFMADFRERFKSIVIAELRGFSDEGGTSPFWDAVGQHFFHVTYAESDKLTLTTNKQFITDLMPRNPLYVNLLPKTAQDVIGKTHPLTKAALNILLAEGFKRTNYVDIFDAGPTIEASLDEISSITNSQLVTINSIVGDVSGPAFILANGRLDFRATQSQILIESGKCIISKETAALLQVKCGDTIRVASMGDSK